MTVARLNALPREEALAQFARCCGATRWAAAMADRRPFPDGPAALAAAEEVWRSLGPSDWLEAFSSHPRIGDVEGLRKRFAATADWAAGEQSGAAGASEETLAELARLNAEYERRFGHIFIVCAAGRTAAQMLALLAARLARPPADELAAAAEEQLKITKLRLEKLP